MWLDLLPQTCFSKLPLGQMWKELGVPDKALVTRRPPISHVSWWWGQGSE